MELQLLKIFFHLLSTSTHCNQNKPRTCNLNLCTVHYWTSHLFLSNIMKNQNTGSHCVYLIFFCSKYSTDMINNFCLSLETDHLALFCFLYGNKTVYLSNKISTN